MITSKEENIKKKEMPVPGELHVIAPCYPKSKRFDSMYPSAKMNPFRDSGIEFIGVITSLAKRYSSVYIRMPKARSFGILFVVGMK